MIAGCISDELCLFKVDNDLKLHSRAVATRDVDKSLTKWIGYDCNHLRAKFNL